MTKEYKIFSILEMNMKTIRDRNNSIVTIDGGLLSACIMLFRLRYVKKLVLVTMMYFLHDEWIVLM